MRHFAGTVHPSEKDSFFTSGKTSAAFHRLLTPLLRAIAARYRSDTLMLLQHFVPAHAANVWKSLVLMAALVEVYGVGCFGLGGW